ncbi:hypothetical protein CCS41_11795 [Candidatus Fukatsuia symbiotica]|uniref:Uncharacterized protein n=1 Tax=Candidatus Fukatsuia symbiotica TaxID=1878942 RepID=A0A2U8I794_9GAMM|nr:hypothetical protein CCS41_11795 [Candidatus Fukatsuia symbiotica]
MSDSSDEEKTSKKAQFTLCIQQKGVNEHFELVFDEISASTKDFELALKHEASCKIVTGGVKLQ